MDVASESVVPDVLLTGAVTVSWRRLISEIVERRHAVGFRPHADRTWTRDVAVVQLDIGFAIEQDADPGALELGAQRVPGIARHRRIDIFDRPATAALGVVERDVVLERIGARDIVVVAVLPAPHHAARLVLATGERLELHFDRAVGKRRALLDAPGERTRSGLLEHVGRAGRAGVGFDRPARRTAAGAATHPAGRHRAGWAGVEVDGLGAGGGGERGEHRARNNLRHD